MWALTTRAQQLNARPLVLPLATIPLGDRWPSQGLATGRDPFSPSTARCAATLIAALNGASGTVQFTVDLQHGRQLTTKTIETCC
jgi:hypothetical protein